MNQGSIFISSFIVRCYFLLHECRRRVWRLAECVESSQQQTLCSFLPSDLFSYFPPPVLKQMATTGSKKGGKGAEKLTFSLNGGGMGRGDAAVTMQQRLWLFLSPILAKARFMTLRIPSYFSNSCTPWVVYLGLRAFLWSLSAWGLYDLQRTTRGSKKDTVLVLTSKSTAHLVLNKNTC